MADLDKTGNGS